ncbi:hypothetical protein AGMMS49975_04260 [Clostridia bacterium]|nr:hypothetical protein AGMMS49975_04260 [Clostridia bacterium]
MPKNVNKSELCEICERVLIEYNTAILGNAVLCEFITQKMRPYRHLIEESVQNFRENGEPLNLDGFIRFRLWEYEHIVHLFLYKMAKRELSVILQF